MDLYVLGGVGVLVLALAFMFARFGSAQGAGRGGDGYRSRKIRPPFGARRPN